MKKRIVDVMQIFHVFLFNIRNYPPEVNNIQLSQATVWSKAALKITKSTF